LLKGNEFFFGNSHKTLLVGQAAGWASGLKKFGSVLIGVALPKSHPGFMVMVF